MAKHQVPRWMNVLWLLFVVCMVGSYLVVALRRGYDLVLTVGFLAANFMDMFMLAVVAGLFLYGVSFLLRVRNPRKSLDETEDEHSNDMSNLFSP